ncbi:MAG: ATP-binding protein [Acidobacteriota bacterium]
MEISATFDRQITALEDVFQLVETMFTAGEINADMRFPVDLAIEEIFTNFVKYNPDGEGGIIICLTLDRDELKMALTDSDSAPFDLIGDAPAVDIDQPLQQRTRGKLGVHLVKTIMDRVEYVHRNRISTITLYKRVG